MIVVKQFKAGSNTIGRSFQQRSLAMTRYQITFFKTVANSVGREQRITQRIVPCAAESCEEAVRSALKIFSEAEHIPDWRLHADALEVSFA